MLRGLFYILPMEFARFGGGNWRLRSETQSLCDASYLARRGGVWRFWLFVERVAARPSVGVVGGLGKRLGNNQARLIGKYKKGHRVVSEW